MMANVLMMPVKRIATAYTPLTSRPMKCLINRGSLLPVIHQHIEPGSNGNVKRRIARPTWRELSPHRVLRTIKRTRISTIASAITRARMLAMNIPLMPQFRPATKRTLNKPMPKADKMPTMTKARLLPNPRNT